MVFFLFNINNICSNGIGSGWAYSIDPLIIFLKVDKFGGVTNY